MAKFSKSKVEAEENKNEEVVEKTTKVEEPKVEQPKENKTEQPKENKTEQPKVENEKAKEVTKVVKPESLADFLF